MMGGKLHVVYPTSKHALLLARPFFPPSLSHHFAPYVLLTSEISPPDLIVSMRRGHRIFPTWILV